MKKLMIFGDSIIKGVTYNGQGYHLCQGHGFDALRAQGIQVDSFAKMGACITDVQPLLARTLQPTDTQTTVLLCCGGNDSDYDWSAISAAPTAAHQPKTPPTQFIDLYCNAVRAAQSSGARVALCTLPPLEPTRFFAHISKGLDADAILQWLGDIGHLYRWQEYYSTLVTQLSRCFGCQLVELRSEFLKSDHFSALIGADGIHPTQDGHALIHSAVQAALVY